jgi:hypothetical protein
VHDLGRRAVAVVGLLLAILGGLGIIGALVDLSSGAQGPVDVAVLLLLFGALLVGGAWLTWTRGRPRPDDPERCILALAEARRGRLTVDEVAAHCQLGLEQAKQLLDRLTAREAARMLVTEDGVVVYHFPGFLSPSEKDAAADF